MLVDSNILVRVSHTTDPQHQLALDATAKLKLANQTLCIVPQNIYEYWSVATRPTAVNGLGFSATFAQNELARLRHFFDLLDESPGFFSEWERLVALHGIVGKKAHDARLVAAMIVHGITHLLTFNKQDFQRFTNISVLGPADVMAMP